MDETKPVGYLQDNDGNNSYVRVMSMFSFLASILTALFIFLKPPVVVNNQVIVVDSFTGLYIFTAFLVGGFAPKVIQKFAEILPLVIKK